VRYPPSDPIITIGPVGSLAGDTFGRPRQGATHRGPGLLLGLERDRERGHRVDIAHILDAEHGATRRVGLDATERDRSVAAQHPQLVTVSPGGLIPSKTRSALRDSGSTVALARSDRSPEGVSVKEAVRTPGEASASAHRRSESRSRERLAARSRVRPSSLRKRSKFVRRIASATIKQTATAQPSDKTIEERGVGRSCSIMAPEDTTRGRSAARRHGILYPCRKSAS